MAGGCDLSIEMANTTSDSANASNVGSSLGVSETYLITARLR